jgi:hypothetical protein
MSETSQFVSTIKRQLKVLKAYLLLSAAALSVYIGPASATDLGLS